MRGSLIALGLLATLVTPASAQRRSPKPPAIVQTPPPVFIPTPVVETYGDWLVRPTADIVLATTENESNAVFGIACSKGCTALVNFRKTCTKGNSYPGLVNSSAGSFTVDMKCLHLDKVQVLSMALNETLVDSLEIGGVVGIAIPMQSGEFHVTRFSLTGGLKAARRALEIDKARNGDTSSKGLKDFSL